MNKKRKKKLFMSKCKIFRYIRPLCIDLPIDITYIKKKGESNLKREEKFAIKPKKCQTVESTKFEGVSLKCWST